MNTWSENSVLNWEFLTPTSTLNGTLSELFQLKYIYLVVFYQYRVFGHGKIIIGTNLNRIIARNIDE